MNCFYTDVTPCRSVSFVLSEKSTCKTMQVCVSCMPTRMQSFRTSHAHVSCVMCYCNEVAAATVCACLTVNHDAACCLTAHSEGDIDIDATIYTWHHDLITMSASNVRPITASQQIHHLPKPPLKVFTPTKYVSVFIVFASYLVPDMLVSLSFRQRASV